MISAFKFLIFLSIFSFILTAPSCKDQNNKDVDWFVSYKMPTIHDGSLPGVGDGTAFYYMDVSMNSFVPSAKDLESNQQALAFTLQQYYAKKASLNSTFILYNDEFPIDVNKTYSMFQNEFLNDEYDTRTEYVGHLKGVLYFERSGGFWLVHSMPKFPSPHEYLFANNTRKYGQSILCMTFNYEELTKMGTQLYYNHPNIYASNLATSMAAENPDLAKVISGLYKKGSPFSSTLTLQTREGQNFLSFAKSADFGRELYDVLVAPSLQTPLYVETWRDGKHVPLDCTTKYRVLDAETMKVEQTSQFNSTKDHSKLAVSTDSSKPYVCIGDINRIVAQSERGGGTVCIQSKKLWSNYKPMFILENSC